MGLIIDDGTGNGHSVKVTGENQLSTSAITKTLFHHLNHSDGQVYHMLFDTDPAGNDDCILYLKNEAEEKDLVINGLQLYIAGACEITWKLKVEGTPVGGTNVIPVNMNAGSGKLASGTFQYGEDITGLTGGDDAFKYVFTGALRSTGFQPDGDIIIPKNQTFALYVDTAGVRVAGHVGFGYAYPDH